MNTRPLLLAVSIIGLLISACSQPTDVQTPSLEPQFGTALDDRADAVATDPQRGAVYVAGTDSIDPDEPGEQGGNIFLRRYNRDGSLNWQKRLFSTYTDPRVNGLYTDTAGNVYIGWSEFSLDGYLDAVLVKLDPSGRQLYRVDLDNGIRDFELDAKGNAYISGLADRDGQVEREFVRKYNARGQKVWGRARLYDSSYDIIAGFEVPIPDELSPATDGSLYVRGYIDGKSVLTKYSSGGRALWQRSLPRDFSSAIVTASGNDVYLSSRHLYYGETGNVTVRKYDANGNKLLDRTLAGTETVFTRSLRLDKAGNIYLVGSITRGDKDLDLIVRKYNAAFETIWTYAPKLTGTWERAAEVALTDSRSVFVVGGTTSRVNGKNFGGADAFLLHLNNQGKKVWSR